MEHIAKHASSLIGNINPFSKSIQGNFWGSDSKNEDKSKKSQTQKMMRIPKIMAQNIIFNTISNFMYHFVNFNYATTWWRF